MMNVEPAGILLESQSLSEVVSSQNNGWDIFQSYYDEYTLLRIFGFFGGVMASFFLAWILPTMLEKIFRDSWGIQINYNSKAYKKMLINYHFKKRKSNKKDPP